MTGREFTANSVVKQATVNLNDSRSAHFTNWAGAASNYATVRFTVPAGQAVLNSSIAWSASAAEASGTSTSGSGSSSSTRPDGWRRTRCRRASAGTAARRC